MTTCRMFCRDHVTSLAKTPGVFFLFTQLVIISVGSAGYCGPPPYVVGTHYNSSSQQYYSSGTILSYTCEAGYYGQGSKSIIRCVASGSIEWEFPHSPCAPVACGDPGSVSNSARQGHLFTYRSKVEYACREGYIMTSGDAVRYCQANSKWSGELPSCTIINCSIPERPENGQALYSGLTYGSVVKYECRGRLALDGNERRFCQSSGHWTGTTPKCVDVDCGKPRLDYPSGKVKVIHDTRYNAIIEYRCNNGETERATCQKHGRWEPAPPDCMNITVVPTTSTMHAVQTSETPPVTNAPRQMPKICNYRVIRWLCAIG